MPLGVASINVLEHLDAHFIGYQHDAVLITYLYVSDSEIVGRAPHVGAM